MTKKLTYLLIALLPITATAQNFAPIGATWHYEEGTPLFPYPGYHYLYESVKDTTINAQPCRKIQVIQYAGTIDTLQPEYVYSDSNRIYYYGWGKFNMLFDFNAQEGDTLYITDPYYHSPNPDTISGIIIDSIRYLFEVLLDSTIFSGNDSLLVFFTSQTNPGTELLFRAPVIEHIGSTWLFLTEAYNMLPYADNNLRCYQDSGTSFTPYPYSCDFYQPLAIEENNPQQGTIEIYPNPFTQTTTITLQGIQLPATLTIYDNLGRAVRKETITIPQHTIHRNNLSSGIYFYRIGSQTGLPAAQVGKIVISSP